MAAPALERTDVEAPGFSRVAFTGRLASMSRRDAAALVRSKGGTVVTTVSRRTSMLVVGMDGWPLLEDGTVSSKLSRAETLRDQGAPVRIVSEEVFLEHAGAAPRRAMPSKHYSFDQVCTLLGLEAATLERWEMLGLVRSCDGQYDFQDIVSLRTIAELIGRGVKPARIATTVRGLASVLPDAARPLAQLTLVEQSGTLLAEIEGALLAPDGQLVIDFDPPPPSAPPPFALSEVEAAQPESVDAWFEHAVACEEEERFEEAADAYRKVLAAAPRFPDAHFNLGNVLRAQGRLEAAEEHFRMAVDQDPQLAAAWYNLGDLQEERGRLDDAIASLETAVSRCPTFADARYNLALCYEAAGRDTDARDQWTSYLRLDSTSVWAVEARARLSSS